MIPAMVSDTDDKEPDTNEEPQTEWAMVSVPRRHIPSSC